MNGNGLRSGNNRMRFSPDGESLYIGQSVRGWGAPAEGLQRITAKNGEVFDISKFSLTENGFALTFTEDLSTAAQDPDTYTFQSYTYQSRWAYGGPQENKRAETVTEVRLTGPRTVNVTLGRLAAGRVYQLNLPELVSGAGSKLHNRSFCYTANRLR